MTPDPSAKENATQTTIIGTAEMSTSHQHDEISKFSGPTPIVETLGTDFTYRHQIVWKNVFAYLMFHIIGVVGLLMIPTLYASPMTVIYTYIVLMSGGIGLTMGAHRHFTHKSFKATTITRRVLMVLFVLNGQNSLWEWARDHRQHHKYSDTDADPHNASRGFFFSHVGWLLSKKHPLVFKYGKNIDMSDLEADSWVMFQRKYFLIYYIVVSIFLPCVFPVLLWNEDPIVSLLVVYFGRTMLGLNVTWFVNSLAHIYGMRPYDKNLLPTQNHFVSTFALGEGWHNYHHAFPWDYRTAELGTPTNLAATVIDFCAKRGWVYDLKFGKEESIKRRVERSGDNSHSKYGKPEEFKGTETMWNIWNHPRNPTYTTKDQKPGPVTITREGYVLFDNEKKVE
ncbi:hypothetical protein DMENIID0001_115630 [Sergentomyia squamirostris]